MRSIRAALIATVFAIAFAACGGDEESVAPGAGQEETAAVADPAAGADLSAGKRAFYMAGCETCHSLADAGSTTSETLLTSIVGPNLDESQPSYELVIDRFMNGKGEMPAFSPEAVGGEKQVANLAAYVSLVAGSGKTGP